MESTRRNGEESRAAWPIIVGGCHRSGTSLLRRVLDAHSRIHCGPEMKFFRDFYGEYFDDPLAPYRFTRTARAFLPEDELVEVLGRAFVTVHEQAARRAGKPRWADKAPENVLYAEQWQKLLGDSWLLVHLVRNPLDTLASMDGADMPLTFPTDLEERIAFYRRFTEAGLEFGLRRPDRYVCVVYEDLAANPREVLGLLMAFLGEELEADQLDFNSVPHEPGLEDPSVAKTTSVHAASVDRWRRDLSSETASAVWAATQDLWERIDGGRAIWSPETPVTGTA
jgi:hypothetical protein